MPNVRAIISSEKCPRCQKKMVVTEKDTMRLRHVTYECKTCHARMRKLVPTKFLTVKKARPMEMMLDSLSVPDGGIVHKMVRDKKSASMISKSSGMPVEIIYAYLCASGMRKQLGRRALLCGVALTDENRKKILELYILGYSKPEITHMTGVCLRDVFRVIMGDDYLTRKY